MAFIRFPVSDGSVLVSERKLTKAELHELIRNFGLRLTTSRENSKFEKENPALGKLFREKLGNLQGSGNHIAIAFLPHEPEVAALRK